MHPLHLFNPRTPTLVLLLGLLALLLPASTARAQMSSVGVTIDSITNKGCFDQFIFCGKPDMMVRVSLQQTDGTLVHCPDITLKANTNNIVGPIDACPGVPGRGRR